MKSGPKLSVAVPIWLLQHLGDGASRDALIGDLLERVAEGQTAGWLWREVLIELALRVWKVLTRYQEIVSAALGTSIAVVQLRRLSNTVGGLSSHQEWHEETKIFCTEACKASAYRLRQAEANQSGFGFLMYAKTACLRC